LTARGAETYCGYRRNEAHGRPHRDGRRPERIRVAKGQTPVPPTAGLPLARLCRDVATQGYGYVRSVLHRANVRIAAYNAREAKRRRHLFTPWRLIHPTKKGPGRGTW
jgi:hypothetical protein